MSPWYRPCASLSWGCGAAARGPRGTVKEMLSYGEPGWELLVLPVDSC